MSNTRRTDTSKALPMNTGNAAGIKEKGLGVKRTGSGIMQSGLGFAAKKSIHPSPAKKKVLTSRITPEPAQPIDLTDSSPPAPSKAYAPLFDRPKRTASTTNPFEEDDEEKPAFDRLVERDDFGFVKTIPTDFAPLGKGKPTAEMLENLLGTAEKVSVEGEGREEEEHTESDVGEEEVDSAFFHTEKPRSDVPVNVDADDEEIPLKNTRLRGVEVRKAMDKALRDIESAQNGKTASTSKSPVNKSKENKLNPKDKKWDAIYKETQMKMGGVDDPIHCTAKTHDRVHHILRVFDLTTEWGPCTGISRLERWNRAEAWGLEPPSEVRDILLTREGATDASYRETIFHDRGIYVP